VQRYAHRTYCSPPSVRGIEGEVTMIPFSDE
jgi:hypothetical protein